MGGPLRLHHQDHPPEVDGPRDYLNSLDDCSAAEFAIGTAQDVQQTGCLGFGQRPGADCPADDDVVKRHGDDVFFGPRPADNDMCTAAKRPTGRQPQALITSIPTTSAERPRPRNNEQ